MKEPLQTMDQIRLDVVEERLIYFKGNKTRVAASLGITLKTLYNWLEGWGLLEYYVQKPGPRKYKVTTLLE